MIEETLDAVFFTLATFVLRTFPCLPSPHSMIRTANRSDSMKCTSTLPSAVHNTQISPQETWHSSASGIWFIAGFERTECTEISERSTLFYSTYQVIQFSTQSGMHFLFMSTQFYDFSAQYGSEAILRDIYEKSGAKWRIHVSQKKFQEYLCTDDLGDCTDSDFTSAQWIHACSWREEKTRKSKEYFIREIPCQDGPFEVCQIRPSAMYFRKERLNELEDKVVKCIGGQSYRVCYSCHSSMAELLDFVKHFQPRKVVPTVIPPGGTTMAEVGVT